VADTSTRQPIESERARIMWGLDAGGPRALEEECGAGHEAMPTSIGCPLGAASSRSVDSRAVKQHGGLGPGGSRAGLLCSVSVALEPSRGKICQI
jgi:hypothetical protein